MTPPAVTPPDDPADETAPPPSALKVETASAAKWSGIAFVGRLLSRLVLTIPLAHLLAPHEFGIVGQASVMIAFAALFLDQGFSAALIQKRDVTRLDRGSVFQMNMASALALALLFFLSAPLIADFFHTGELEAVVRVLSIDFLFLGLAVVPRAMLQRKLRMRVIAVAEVGPAVIGTLIGIAAAYFGAEYWALVIQTLSADLMMAAILLVAAGRPALRGSREAMRGLRGFSLRVMGSQILGYASRNLDNVLIGRYLGPAALGLYALSYRTMMVGVQGIGQVANRVAFPVYSRLQDDRPALRRYFVGTAGLLALGSSPLLVLVILAAPLGVPFVFGEAWRGAVVPMQILAGIGLMQAVLTTTGTVFLACGRADWQLRWTIGSTIVVVSSFVLGLQWGIEGVAACYAVASLAMAPLSVYFVGRLLDFSVPYFFKTLIPPAGASLCLVAAWVGADFGLQALDAPAAVKLAVCSVVALAAYLAALRLVWPAELARARELAGLMVRGGPNTERLAAESE
jgi:PST family polysaccharide transporter